MFSVESGIETHQPHFIQYVKWLEENHMVRSIWKTATKREVLEVIKMHIKYFSGKGNLDLWLTWDACHQQESFPLLSVGTGSALGEVAFEKILAVKGRFHEKQQDSAFHARIWVYFSSCYSDAAGPA